MVYNPLGKTKKVDFKKEMAKETAIELARKQNPELSKKKVRKIADKVDKKQGKKNKMFL